MPRVKRGKTHVKRRQRLLKTTRGFRAGQKNLLKLAKAASKKAGQKAYDHRRLKKRDMRATHQMKINAAARLNGTTYSKFIHHLKQKGIILDRKVLADLAQNYPEVFAALTK